MKILCNINTIIVYKNTKNNCIESIILLYKQYLKKEDSIDIYFTEIYMTNI